MTLKLIEKLRSFKNEYFGGAGRTKFAVNGDIYNAIGILENVILNKLDDNYDDSKSHNKNAISIQGGNLYRALKSVPKGAQYSPANDKNGEYWHNPLKNIDVSGEVVTPFADDFVGLTAVPANAGADAKYWTILKTDVVGTGSAGAPQYPKGVYISGATAGAGWFHAYTLSADFSLYEIKDADLIKTATNYNKQGVISAEQLEKFTKANILVEEVSETGAPLGTFGKLLLGRNADGSAGGEYVLLKTSTGETISL